jgi:hypothetical protein
MSMGVQERMFRIERWSISASAAGRPGPETSLAPACAYAVDDRDDPDWIRSPLGTQPENACSPPTKARWQGRRIDVKS